MKRAATLVVAAVALCAAAATAATLEERAATCASCHGERGSSTIEGIPSLAGQPEFFLMNQLILMREGVRPVPQMEPFVKDLRDEEILALARRYAAEPPQRTPEKVDPALAARGEEIARRLRCASCHLPSLEGQEQMPRLAGQRIDYMIAALKAYRDNTRAGADTQMSAVVFGASDADIEAMAHYAAAK